MLVSLIIIFCLVLLNGVFAMGELALISARRARLAVMSKAGIKGADRALKLANDPQGFLPTVQVGMTLVSILEGTFGGTSIEARMTHWLLHFPRLAPFASEISMTVVVSSITAIMLVGGELVPKQIALRQPEQIATRLALPLEGLAWISRPVVWLLGRASGLVLRLMRVSANAGTALTEEELRAYIAEGAQAGVLEQEERDMIERLLRMADRPVRAIMTPRTELCWIERHVPRAELLRILRSPPIRALLSVMVVWTTRWVSSLPRTCWTASLMVKARRSRLACDVPFPCRIRCRHSTCWTGCGHRRLGLRWCWMNMVRSRGS